MHMRIHEIFNAFILYAWPWFYESQNRQIVKLLNSRIREILEASLNSAVAVNIEKFHDILISNF